MTNIRILRPISLVIMISMIIGCTSIPIAEVNQRFTQWESSTIDEIIKYWGVPTKTQKVNGTSYAEWINKESEPGNTSISVGSGTHSRNSSIGIGFTLFDLGGTDDLCSRIVTYQDNGQVLKVVWKGTQEFCFELTPDLLEVRAASKAIMDKG